MMDWRIAIAIAIVAGVFGGTTVPHLSPGTVRPDPFTGKDAKAMEERITKLFMHQHEVLKLQLNSRIPPESVRSRIESLEHAMDEVHEKVGLPPYRPPTTRFHNDLWTMKPSGGGGGE
jgi:hypothetical protein